MKLIVALHSTASSARSEDRLLGRSHWAVSRHSASVLHTRNQHHLSTNVKHMYCIAQFISSIVASKIQYTHNKKPELVSTKPCQSNAFRLPRIPIHHGSIQHSRSTSPALNPGHKIQSRWRQEGAQKVPKTSQEHEQEEQRYDD